MDDELRQCKREIERLTKECARLSLELSELSCARSVSLEQSRLDVMRSRLHAIFNGGYQAESERIAFHHGMDTVCNILSRRANGQDTNGVL